MLEDLLTSQEQQLQALFDLLQEERKCLEQASPDELLVLTKQKLALLDVIQDLDKKIAKFSPQLHLKDNPEIAQYIEHIQALLQQSKELNQVNGEIIAGSQSRLRQYATVVEQIRLHGASTYNKDGHRAPDPRLGRGLKA